MQELKKMKIWVLWHYAKVHGRITKVPFAASGGPSGTDDKFRDTWVSYEEILRAASSVKCDGIGFILPCGYFLLDIDHRDLDDPLAKTLLERFGNTYSEYSVSGHGVHVLGKEKQDLLPTYIDNEGNLRLSQEFYQRNSKDHVELYHGGLTNRFVTYTGEAIHDAPLADCTDAVLTTLDKNMRKSVSSRKSAPKPSSEPSADKSVVHSPEQSAMTREELEAAAFDAVSALRKQKNSEKFIRLYDQGNLTGYGSQSEADLALCSIIAFRTGDNPQLIDYIFRGSKLYREKWEREDYREGTIRKALLLCEDNGLLSETTLPPFIRISKKNGPVLMPSRLAQYIRETVPYFLVQNNSKQATQLHVFQDGCYRLCDKNRMMGIIKKPVEEYNIDLVTIPKISEAYNQLITDRERIPQSMLNADENLINMENGLVEVTPTRVTLYPHSSEIYSTIQIPCKWTGEETPTPVFDEYMKTLTNNNPERIQLLLEFIGVSISNVQGWRMKKALIMVGPGDTGKSILKSLTEMILGEENCIAMDPQEIETRFGTGMIYGTRLVGSSDTGYMAVNELKTIKKLTGGDWLFVEFKGQQGFTYRFPGVLWFCANGLPKFGGDDGKWVYERFMIVRCNNVIPRDKQDKKLLDKLYAEREGIVYKAIRALQTVLENGYRFSEPESVVAERMEYMKENNSVVAFFHECMCPVTDEKSAGYCTTSVIYKYYKEWCRDNNNGYAKSMKQFRDKLAEILDKDTQELIVHINIGSVFDGYTVTEETKRTYDFFAA